MSDPQWFALAGFLTWTPIVEFHHGDCLGSDAEAHDTVAALATTALHVHPPAEPYLRAWRRGHVMYAPLPYLQRNRIIVDITDHLIAAPDGPEKQRSGAWSTVRYARKQGKPFSIIMPNGEWV